MKKIRLTETELISLVKRVINEQGSAFDWESSLDGWDIQKDAREEGKYCHSTSPSIDKNSGGARYFEGQYCNVDTNWYDWESSPGVKTMGVSSSGKWKCGVGCMVTQGEDR